MAEKLLLSVIIPAYNEEPNFKPGVLDEVPKYLKKQSYSYEVIIVDDGSEDNTAKLADKFASNHKNFRVIKNPHQGKAETVKTGVEKLLSNFTTYDIVIGSRQRYHTW